MEWLPIETAPRDGTEILGWCCHDADPYFEDEGRFLTPYGAHCEGMNRVSDGPHVVVWGGEYKDGDYESGFYTIPAWWFRSDSDFEVAANPTHWMPIPEDPNN